MRFINIKHYLSNDESALNLCEKEIAEYNCYFDENVRNALPKNFVTEYFKSHGFHDWIIQSIHNQFDGNNHTILIQLYDNYANKTKTLKYQKVKCFHCNFNTEHFENTCNDEYGIDEFYKIGEKHFSHEVYCPSGSNYYIEFQKISIV